VLSFHLALLILGSLLLLNLSRPAPAVRATGGTGVLLADGSCPWPIAMAI